ncbi:MAG: hypothetical protein ACTSRA_05755, partial [Promethearchaeota archaeon]
YCKERFKQKYGRDLIFVGPHEWDKANVDGICDWGACFEPKYPATHGIPAGAVSPGFYNLGAIALQGPIYHTRDIGRYRQEWKNMIDLGAAWVHVETWNELHEGTDICWTQEFGYQWIDATREMADIFHSLTGYQPLSSIDGGALIGALACFIIFIGVGFYILTRERDLVLPVRR